VLAVNALGLITLKSAAPSPDLMLTQLVGLAVGIGGAVVLQLASRRQVMAASYSLFAISLFLLLAVLVFGREVNGAKAWFVLGPFRFQPSELAKIALVLSLARVAASRPLVSILDYLKPLALAAPALALVLVEPDLGGAMVMAATVFAILFVRGMPTRHLLAGLALLAVLVPVVLWPNLKPYQQERVQLVLNPEQDPLGGGFQMIQSKIAIGSGGLFGKGYGQGTQTQLGFVPFRHTDFIFAVLAEEWGFVGALGLLLLYAILFLRLVRMAQECGRLEDQLVLVGIFFHALLPGISQYWRDAGPGPGYRADAATFLLRG
ncbi:MAG: FtsW/RodA/SpoVE family cell cycle protein, partial [Deinococcus sp.]|nr:FtsW/RodA/SpoVE family cell cycle protein [Deinococcus sp.]